MKIASKIIVPTTLLCVVGLVFAGTFIGWKVSNLSEEALYERTKNQLISVREVKSSELERYFNQIRLQLDTLADDVATQQAMVAFQSAFQSYPNDDVPESDRSRLADYYTQQFGTTYKNANKGQPSNSQQKYQQLSEIAQALQARYIALNSNPLGEKHLLMSDSLGTDYDEVHQLYHPSIKHFLEAFGYYDIFLVDLDGNIVYSVFKELDFATNLRQGPYQGSGISKAFLKAVNKSKGEYHLEDFAPYYPSYEAAASFIATPIYHQGKKVGVLIFQMPVDEINTIMTFNENWKNIGLGDSGESYLVGPDGLLRSQSRFLIEAPEDYFTALQSAGLNANLIQQIEDKGSAIGRQPVDTIASRKALKGEKGFLITPDYREVDVFSAYAPVNAAGLPWAILTEVDVAEAMADTQTLIDSVFNTIVVIIIIVVMLSVALSYLVGSSISKPISAASQKVKDISESNDLTQRLKEVGRDEMTELSVSLNALFSQLQNVFTQFASASHTLRQDAITMSKSMEETQASILDQNNRTTSVATAINEMSASISEVSQFANKASEHVSHASESGTQGVRVGQALGNEIGQLNQEMEASVQAIKRLNKETSSIAEVLDVIQGIAEQTSLLALNAAIEAARAGDQGRGFAVVADEVRSLSGRTQASTEEIRDKIDALQNETNNVSRGIENANETVQKGVETCTKNTDMLSEIMSMLSEISDMNTQVASATDEQKSVTEEINSSITSIAGSTSSVQVQVEDTDKVLKKLSDQADTLTVEISRFKYS
ncbi:chemotaxis protein [Vibrio alginolyticus]|nr:chemotaxis protein [Vibrio alginolyticus]